MNQVSLATALEVVRHRARHNGAALDGTVLREIQELCTGLFTDLAGLVGATHRAPVALGGASWVEEHYRAVIRAQLAAIAALEATGAHRLEVGEYDRLRQNPAGTQGPVLYATGRPVYKDTTALLESWVGINYFEARTRVEDTHRVQARRNSAGQGAGPRFERLAGLFQDPGRDPRPVRDAARRLEALEPPTVGQELSGVLPGVAARAGDGRLLEEHATEILVEHDPVTAAKRLTGLCTGYRKANESVAKPEVGIFRRATVLGVDQYLIRVEGLDAELLRSAIAQADNPRTQAGAAARSLSRSGKPGPQDSTQDNTQDNILSGETTGPGRGGDQGCAGEGSGQVPAWLVTDQPPPPWAIDPDTEPGGPDTEPGGPDTESGNAAEATPAVDSDVGPGAAGPGTVLPHSGVSTPDRPGTGAGRGTACPASTPTPQGFTQPLTEQDETDPNPTGTDTAGTDTAGMAEGPGPDRVEGVEAAVPRRRLQALLDLMRARVTGAGALKTIAPQVVVYMQLQDLMNLAEGHGITSRGVTAHGVELDAGQLRQALSRARIIPVVLGGDSQVLDVGRARRDFNVPMCTGLQARDRGCIMPGCTYPPEMCEAHHWKNGGWAGGCGTSVGEGGLLCPREHDDYHAGKFKIVDVNGLPHVVLPKHLDPSQTPRRNRYWFASWEDPSKPGQQAARQKPPEQKPVPGQTNPPKPDGPPPDTTKRNSSRRRGSRTGPGPGQDPPAATPPKAADS
ncbi:hypothetical protein ACF046_09555 [Glutamicibacter creatinolyticus]|uniref:HNH endonuclease signature motif containing protein n=2 Tax=Glutamicibacter creatinolyticus TaxID=162496 RepID=UPI0034040D6D